MEMECQDDDDVGELLALMDSDDDKEAQEEDAGTSKLEEEYQELERKMLEIKEKMKKKVEPAFNVNRTNLSVDASTPSEGKGMQRAASKSLPKACDEEKKSSFLSAMASAEFVSPAFVAVDANNTPGKLIPKSKRPMVSQNDENALPPQKRRRVTNISQSSPSHPFTESLRHVAPQKKVQQLFVADSHKAKQKGQNEQLIVESEYFSRIRMKKCFVPNDEMKQRMQGKRFLKLGLIRSTMKISEDTDWVTIGVVCKQLDRQTTKNGKPFSIWHLTDLDDCTKTVTFFLFGAVHEKLTNQIAVGSVVGVLNPSIMPPKKDDTQNSSDNSPALTVDVAERVMHIGLAADLGWCTATKWRNKQPAGKCLAVINKQISDVCVFHMKSKYKKTSARRSELQGSVAAPVAKKYRNTLWNNVKNDQFFYGGKVYSATPSGMGENTNKPVEPKVKLTKFLQNHSGLAVDGGKELLEKSKVMNALGGIEGNHSLSGCSQTFADMLASGDNVAGSRQFLNHLNNTKRKQEEGLGKEKARQQTAAEVLKEKADLMKTMKTETRVGEKNRGTSKPGSLLAQLKINAAKHKLHSPQTNFVSPADIKKMTSDIVRAKRLELSKDPNPRLGSAPRLGKGSSSNEIELFADDWAIPKTAKFQNTNAELAKKKAIAKLRSATGDVSIPKKDPNQSILRQVENVRNDDAAKANILRKVERSCGEGTKSNADCFQNATTHNKISKFGSLSKEEFEKILNSRSSFSREIETAEIEEQEKYFNPLVKKEMMEKKMSETFEVSCKVVSCTECAYTFWAPHERCKELQHRLNWKKAKKKFFQCSKCKHRTSTWEAYPSKPCIECGSEKNWQRASMLREKDTKILDAEILLIRGLEHGKFLNSLR